MNKISTLTNYSLFQLSESLCRYGKSAEIYNALKQEIENHVLNIKTEVLSKPVNQGLLTRVNISWNTFCSQLAIIRNVFMELDRSFILPNTKFSSIM
jgi:cullin-4